MTTNETAGLTRRGLFRTGAGAAAAAAVASTASAQTEFDYGDWFEDVPNFEGTVDRTGESEVTVTVGPGGDLVFDPPAVHVDPGTTVVFEWDQGFHNVAERESGQRYGSETTDESGTTYSVTFESDGISTYVCEPHVDAGMKGAVAVGSGEGVPEITEGEMQAGGGNGGGGSEGGGESDGEGGGSGNEGSESGGGEGVNVDTDVLALYGVAALLAFLSPLGLFALMARHARNQPDEGP
ncbi:halocyanin domain-containing protein [Natronomonas marina]|uniref:halocyanin domain-containing protein n=1 Tax=Natronomonas marina TaxID=2961939 RepID=UPI0020C9D9CF|nr:halocyanin domain-containing protein [Natronomonas marina]